MPLDILQMLIVLVILFLLVRPVGAYMAAVFMRKPSAVDRVFDPIDNGIYRLSGVNPNENQRWPAYVKAMLITNFAMWAIMFIILEVQQLLPLNPDGQGPVNPWLAFNTSEERYGHLLSGTGRLVDVRVSGLRAVSAREVLRSPHAFRHPPDVDRARHSVPAGSPGGHVHGGRLHAQAERRGSGVRSDRQRHLPAERREPQRKPALAGLRQSDAHHQLRDVGHPVHHPGSAAAAAAQSRWTGSGQSVARVQHVAQLHHQHELAELRR